MSEKESRNTSRNGDSTDLNSVQLGTLIRSAREALGISTRQLATTVDVHHSFINGLELGKYGYAQPQTLQRLSRALELDEHDLFALAGLEAPEGLPAFTPYLRAKYEMSEEAARALEDHFHYIRDRYDLKPKTGQRRQRSRADKPSASASGQDHPAYSDPEVTNESPSPKPAKGGTQ